MRTALDTLTRPRLWSRLTRIGLVAVPVLYLCAAFCVLRLENAYHTCTMARFGRVDELTGVRDPAFTTLDEGLLPPRSICHWADGQSIDRVPTVLSVALLVAVAVLVAAVTMLAATRIITRRRV